MLCRLAISRSAGIDDAKEAEEDDRKVENKGWNEDDEEMVGESHWPRRVE